mgnify:CR=1 FL=1
MHGDIGSVDIWNRALTAGEVQAIRAHNRSSCAVDLVTTNTSTTTVPLLDGLIHSLCFSTNCNLQDQVGAMHAAVVNSDVANTCVHGVGITLDGSGTAYVNLAAVPLGGEMTIAFWVRY